MHVVRLRDFIAFLSGQSAQAFQGAEVDSYFSAHRVDLDDIIPYTRFREDTCARNQTYRTDLFEVLVLAWLPGQKLPQHDQGGQRSWITVELGELCFQEFSEPAGLKTKKPKLAGELVYIDDSMGFHSIENASSKPALSLHIHSKPILENRVYDEATKEFRLVEQWSFPPPPEMEWNTERPLVLE